MEGVPEREGVCVPVLDLVAVCDPVPVGDLVLVCVTVPDDVIDQEGVSVVVGVPVELLPIVEVPLGV